MSLPYTLRLLCLCCASFFMIHLALAVATPFECWHCVAHGETPEAKFGGAAAVCGSPASVDAHSTWRYWLSVFPAICGWSRKRLAKKWDWSAS